MTVSTANMNSQKFLQLGENPPGVKLELVDGVVAASPTQAPRHGCVVTRLSRILDQYIEDNDRGELHPQSDRAQGVESIQPPPFPQLEIPLIKLWRKRRSNA